jgi:hypothetical protein
MDKHSEMRVNSSLFQENIIEFRLTTDDTD